MKPLQIILLIALAGLTGCATQSSLESTRNDVDAVRTRLNTVERNLGGIRNESREGIGTIEKNVKSDVDAVRKLSADIQATIDSTKTDMQVVNGRVDDLAISIKKPTEDLARYREDADKRIVALEDRIIRLQSTLDDLTKKMSDLAKPKEAAPTPESVYTKGLEIFKSGDMPAARDVFSKFLEQYPQHDLAANAHYWIGETYYSEKNYEPAILAFQEVIKNYPLKDKVPAAMLKQAMAFQAIGDLKSARYVLKKLEEVFPKSDEAIKAKELLKGIK
ncbi:MAG: tol-pal system protein YbgF [Desulfuromonadales bacterium]|nr:tol-pal system protein YbgF [Desulfuromonadales bacterium]